MLIVGNWKAYIEDPKKAKALFERAKKASVHRGRKKGVEIVVAPPAPFIGLLAEGNRSKIALAGQDVSDTTGGAQTGEVTAGALKGMGARFVIIGHSERRARGESDAVIAAKTQHVLAAGLTPIVCVGETERDADAHYLPALRAQIASVLSPLEVAERSQIILAYEPVWAIGKSAAEAITPHELTEMVRYIRKVLHEFIPVSAVSDVRILYGGSVEPGNIGALVAEGEVAGFLVGRASTDATTFAELIQALT